MTIDQLLSECLRELAEDPHLCRWSGKERDWVNYFAHRHLLRRCGVDSVLRDPAQLGIEVSVPQPPGFDRPAVCRDLVIWTEGGETCWNQMWEPTLHPLAIVEWKVHRPGHRNRQVEQERQWLRAYCAWQPETPGYAVEVDWNPSTLVISCTRFFGTTETVDWVSLRTEWDRVERGHAI